MKRSLLMTIALTAVACGSTTTAGAGARALRAQPPSPENASPGVAIDATDGAPDEPSIVVIATSPSRVEFRSDAQDVVVPLRRAHLPAATARRATVMQGMLIGAAIGVIAGAVQTSERDKWAAAHPDAHCDPFSCGGNLMLDTMLFGAMGLGAGAAAGGIIGAFDSP